MLKKANIRHKILISVLIFVLGIACGVCVVSFAQSDSEPDIISEGIHISSLDVSGMTHDEAVAEVTNYVNQLSSSAVDLCIGENIVTIPVSELGFSCDVESIVKKAMEIGKTGNIVKRYKEKKDLEQNGSEINLPLNFSDDRIRAVLEEKCAVYNVAAEDAGLTRVSGDFVITGGKQGISLDVEASLNAIKDYMSNKWDGNSASIDLVTVVTEPKSAGADLDKVKDLLGTATTSYSKSASARCGNVERGASLINGTLLYPGEAFSAYETISPISLENGYFMAPSYENGQVVDSPGGGICQVSTTLYNAVLKAELEVTQRSNHSMIVTYVDPSKDAAIAGTYKDFKFVNNTQYPIYIEGITADKKITFNIYGVETRSASRTIDFVSETVSETPPTVVLAATGDNLGHISSSGSPHKGLVAQLWKVEYENGVEVARNVINHSTYKMSPKTINIGTAGASLECMNELNAAIAANDEGLARAVVAKYVAAAQTVPQEGENADNGSQGVIADPGQPVEQPQQPAEQPQQPAEQPQQPAEQPQQPAEQPVQ